jgi:hypothetical protein
MSPRAFTWLVCHDRLGGEAVCIDGRDQTWIDRWIARREEAIPGAWCEIVHAAPGRNWDGSRLSRRRAAQLEMEIGQRLLRRERQERQQ